MEIGKLSLLCKSFLTAQKFPSYEIHTFLKQFDILEEILLMEYFHLSVFKYLDFINTRNFSTEEHVNKYIFFFIIFFISSEHKEESQVS
jgi:hypothetical protein